MNLDPHPENTHQPSEPPVLVEGQVGPVVLTGASMSQAKRLEANRLEPEQAYAEWARQTKPAAEAPKQIAALIARYNESAEVPLEDLAKRFDNPATRKAAFNEMVGDGSDFIKTFYLLSQLEPQERRYIDWKVTNNAFSAMGNALTPKGDEAPALDPKEREALLTMVAGIFAQDTDHGQAGWDDLLALGATEHGTFESEGRLPTKGHPLLEANARLETAHRDKNPEGVAQATREITEMALTSRLALRRLTAALEHNPRVLGAKPDPLGIQEAREGLAAAIGNRLSPDDIEEAANALANNVFGYPGKTITRDDDFHSLPLLGTRADPRYRWLALPHPEGTDETLLSTVRSLYGKAGIQALDNQRIHELVRFCPEHDDEALPSRGALAAMDAAMTTFENNRMGFATAGGLDLKPLVMGEDHQYPRAMWTLFDAASNHNSPETTTVLIKHMQAASTLNLKWDATRVSRAYYSDSR